MPPRVIIDTSAFFALVSASDQFHSQAANSFERLLDWEWELWTTSNILVETSALVHHRLGFEPLDAFMETVLSELFHIHWVDDIQSREAWKRMTSRRGAGFSMVDWTTVVAAESSNARVFTFDQDFSKEGVLVFPRH